MTSQTILKTVPHNLEAEQALLGIILVDPNQIDDLDALVAASEFYSQLNGIVFACLRDLQRRGQYSLAALHGRIVSNYSTWNRAVFSHTPYEEVASVEYLHNLADKAPMRSRAEHYAELIRKDALLRNAISVGDKIREHAMAGQAVEQVVTQAEWGLRNIANGIATGETWEGPEALCEAAEDVIAGRGSPMYLPTGISIWDEQVGGLQVGRVNLLGARSRMGKSTLAAIVAHNLIKRHLGVGYFSMEMDHRELSLRLACAAAYRRGEPDNPAYFDAVRGRISPTAARKMIAGAQSLRGLPLRYDQRTCVRPQQMESSVVRQLRAWEKDGITPGCFIVDHLMIMDPDQESGNKVVDMTNISKFIRRLALETGVPFLALAQLNRNVDSRSVTDKDPQLQDLGWSGALEQDAAQVMFLTRPSEYMKEPSEKLNDVERADFYFKKEYWQDKAKLIPAKNRMGPTGDPMEVGFDLACNACWDLPQ